jgi:PKD domain
VKTWAAPRTGSFGMRRVLSALVLCAAALFVAVPAAQAAPTWLSPIALGSGTSVISSVAAGSDAAGNVFAAWIRQDASGNTVELASRPAGGGFTIQPLQTGTGSAANVTMAVNRNGDAIIAWRRQNAAAEIWATTRAAGGGFSVPQVIASVPGSSVLDPSTGINQAGAMMVVWRLNTCCTSETIYGAYRPPGGSFVNAPISSTDPWNQSPRVALDESGRATVVWSYWDGGAVAPGSNIARVRIRQPNGTLGTQRNLSGSVATGFPMFATVGLDNSGNAVAVWSQWNGSVYEVQGASRPAASDIWTNLPTFGQSANASFGSEPQVAVDVNGNSVAIWRAANGTINAASRSGGGGFGAAQTGISAPTATNPRVVLDASGNAIAIWQRSDGLGSRIEASVRPLGGQFGAVREISSFNASVPALSIDGLGNAFGIWPLDDPVLAEDADMFAQYAAFDSSAPGLFSVSVPGTGTTGVAAGFGAAAGDTWSPVSYHWNFGDGGTASGPNVSHAYALPGSYTVTVSATDAVGNATGTTRVIQVSSPVPPPPPPPPPGRITGVTLSYDFQAFRPYTRLTRIQVRRVPANSTVRAVCAFKKKKCPGKARRDFVKRNARGTVSLNARYKGIRLKVGTTITVRITKPGFFGAAKIFTVRRGKAPDVVDRCMAVGSTRLRRSC